MPTNTEHIKNKIVYYLLQIKKSDTITREELDEAMGQAGLGKRSRRTYTEDLEESGTIVQASGGWTLAEECYKTGRITITITPDASTIAVTNAIADAVRRFRPLATIEGL